MTCQPWDGYEMSGQMTTWFGLNLDQIQMDHKNVRSMEYLLNMLYFTAFTSVVIILDNPAMP